MVNKFFNICYFGDADNKTKYTIEEKQAEVLIISQFTLFAGVKKGRTPSWCRVETSASAEKLYNLFCKKMQEYYYRVKTGFLVFISSGFGKRCSFYALIGLIKSYALVLRIS